MTTLREHLASVRRQIEVAVDHYGDPPNEFADYRQNLVNAIDRLRILPELEDWPVKATEPNPHKEPIRNLLAEAQEVEADPDIWKLRVNPNISQIQVRFSTFLMHAREECERALSDRDPSGRLVER